ncbi:MAG TPA: inositol monophosphatase family protein [Clostridia bacterium]|jgi:myo-inositol-1(or 4)-monophosphatase|nr:inositol monophosphatase [Clostridiaceae bacterium]HOF27209.1 inositol monophosphatase family protein [Clostridia bacterium]HOM34689.1 inositol monophosphatase family protein [Clostridia bacterium]HOR90300.1 inositol monophosphatase family protein [Clostridia bacterium]HOT70226.1 inositol monophosphatase family protein [Clostridia bacterium]
MDFIKAVNAVLDAGALMKDATYRTNAVKKGDKDYVTACDIAIQKSIAQALRQHYPDIPLIAEEKDNRDILSDSVFILDPLDGTTNFLHGYTPSCISLAYVYKEQPVFGIVHDPVADATYIAEKGKGAQLNGKPIRVSNVKNIENALITCETSPYERGDADMHFDVLKKVFLACMDIRISGSAALDICYVAEGAADAFLTRNLSPWDVAAGICILTEAKGVCTDWKGNPPSMRYKSDILASNGLLQEVLYEYTGKL